MATLAQLVVNLGLDSEDFKAGIAGAMDSANRLGSVVKGAATVAVAGFAAVGAAVGAAALPGLQFNNTMEMVTAQLNAFTKDGAKSAAILDMIKQRAAQTPFEFDAMAQAATALMPASKASGVALEELIEKAEILAASNPAEGLEGAAFSLKEALSGDFTSIIERFNLPRQRLKELKDQGVPALEAVQIAMQELGLDTDLVTNLANTASGRWSTLKDTLVGISATATKPIFDLLSNGLAKVNTWASANEPLLTAIGTTLANNVANGITLVVGGFNSLLTFAAPIVASLQNMALVISTLGFAELFTVFEDGSSAFGSFLEKLGLSEQLATSVTAALGSIVGVVQGVIASLQGMASGGAFDSLVTSIQERISVLSSIVASVLAVIVSTISTYGAQMVASGSAAFTALVTTVSTVFAAINTVVNAILGQVLIFIQTNGAQIAAFFAQTWIQIADIITVAMQLINATVVPILSAIGAFIAAHSSEIQTALTAAWTIISTIITTALDTIKTVITVALQVINGDWTGAWNTIQQFSARFVQSLITIIQSGAQLIAAAFTTLADLITGVWSSIASKAIGFGKAIIDGVISGIKSAGGALLSTLRDLAGQALNAAMNALKIGSPSKTFADRVGVPIIQGWIEGMTARAPAIGTAVKEIGSQVTTKARDLVGAMEKAFQTAKIADSAKGTGTNALNGLIAGMESKVGAAVTKAKSIAQRVVDSMAAKLDIHSPSGVFASSIGVPIIMGIISGMEKAYPKALKWIKGNLGTKLTEFLKTQASFTRSQMGIFRDLFELQKGPDSFEPLVTAQKAYQDSVKSAQDLKEQLADTQKEIEYITASPKRMLDEQARLAELYEDQNRLLAEQAKNQKDLFNNAVAQQAAEAQRNELNNQLLIISEDARRAYEAAQAQAMEMMKTDAKGALDFFNERKRQIAELAELQKERALATDPAEQQMLDTQLELLKGVLAAERQAQNAEIAIKYPGGKDAQSQDQILAILQQALQKAGYKVDINFRTA